LVEAGDAVGTKLRIGYRPAFLADTCHPKTRVRFQQTIVLMGFHQVALRIPVYVPGVDTRGRHHHHGLVSRLCKSGRYDREACGRQSQASCSLDNHNTHLLAHGLQPIFKLAVSTRSRIDGYHYSAIFPAAPFPVRSRSPV
jgi:hypothetical protein